MGLIVAGCVPDVQAENYCPSPQADDAREIWAISADQLIGKSSGNVELQGQVQFEKADNYLRADRIFYSADTKTVHAAGAVQYSRCSRADPDWFINAEQLTLSTDQVVVKNAWFVLGNMPVFYLPRYSMTLNNQRKSGFLIPGINADSSRGLALDTPFYFNLAPHYDAMLKPRWLTRRGLQLDGEYRYLLPLGQGRLRGDWLSDRRHPDDRYSYSFEHDKEGRKARLQLRYQRVSDRSYIDDLGGSLQSYYNSYLRSYVQLTYAWKGWIMNFLGETLQDADERMDADSRPYERRPSFTLQRRFFTKSGNEWNLQTHLTELDYRGSEADKVGSLRYDNLLQWQLPLYRPWFHITPAASIRYTYYDLESANTMTRNRYPDSISRTIPGISLHSGLVFEKNRGDYKHMLEPEIYYLKVPYKDQANIPVYDTAEPAFRFSDLFRDNRFRGTDRIADADQLSVALTRRILDGKSGKEILRASLGQIFYFRSNRVILGETNSAEGSKSDIATELMMNLNERLVFNNAFTWNTDIDRTSRILNRLSMNDGKNRAINLFHRYQRGEYRQIGFNLNLPLSQRWQIFGGWNRDIMNHRNLLITAGFDYRACCWKLRLFGERFLQDLDGDGTLTNGSGDYDTSIGVSFSFSGFGAGQDNVQDIMAAKVSGYGDDGF